MGSKTKAQWTEKEEVAFAEGVSHHNREFELIQRDYLPHKTMGQVCRKVWGCVGWGTVWGPGGAPPRPRV